MQILYLWSGELFFGNVFSNVWARPPNEASRFGGLGTLRFDKTGDEYTVGRDIWFDRVRALVLSYVAVR